MSTSHQPAKKKFRFRLLIYPKFQLRLVVANVCLTAAALAFVGVQLQRAFFRLRELGVTAKIPADHAYFKFLDWQLGQMYSYFAIAFVAAFLLSVAVTLKISHRLAGPLVRLRGYFRKLADEGGPLTEIRFRKGDYLYDLPDFINRALRRVRDESAKRDRVA